jgi:hypothetical protein
MVYEPLQDYFILDDYVSAFDLFFKVCEHITWGHVPPLILCFLSAFRLLGLEKQYGSICPIMISDVTYHLVAHTLVI